MREVLPETKHWASFMKEVDTRGFDYHRADARMEAIDVILDLAQRFLVPTVDALIPEMRVGNPPGGEIYCVELSELPWGTEDLYEASFGDTWEPPRRELKAFIKLHKTNLVDLAEPGAELRCHRAWIGESVSVTVSGMLQDLDLTIDEDADRAQYESEFNKLLPMLELRLANYLTGVLVGTMFGLSKELGRRELTRPHQPYVAATLVVKAGSWRHRC